MADLIHVSLFVVLAVNGLVLVLAVGHSINRRDDGEP